MDLEFISELNGYNNDKRNFPKERERYASRMAFLLKGEMCQDMKDVLIGKKKIKLSFKDKIKYKCKRFINKLIKIF